MTFKLPSRRIAPIAIAAVTAWAGRAWADGIGPSPPPIDVTQRAFLVRIARRTMEDFTLGRSPHEPVYVPEALNAIEVEVVLRLRRRGYLLAEASGGPSPITRAVRDAALGAVEILHQHADLVGTQIDRLLVEIEAVGAAEPVPLDGDWTQPRAVDAVIEPGLHGLALIGRDRRYRFCPTELFTNDIILADALKRIAQNMHAGPEELKHTKLLRFRSTHWYQESSGAAIVSLVRGLTLVPPSAVSPDGLDDAITRVADYMSYRQLPSGLFTYQYEPAHDRYGDENNLVRQAGATMAMSMYADRTGRAAPRAAAESGIRFHLQGLTDLRGVENASFIATADSANKLGLTALLCLAMAEHPDSSRYTDVRERLIGGMTWLQRPSGMFVTAFPPALKLDAQEYFAGEALLAMAVHFQERPSARIADAFDHALDFYRDYFEQTRSPAMVPWHAQAFALMAVPAKRADYANYVFELADFLCERQLDRSNCRWPTLWGGIAAYEPGRAGVATASYLEGLAAALGLARTLGDSERESRYQTAVRAAARFVMQLQVRPEEAYFIRSPQDAVGGIRTTPTLNLLRIDHAQHALVGLMKARQALFPDDG